MNKIIGKAYMVARCPLCNYISILDESEYQFVNQKIHDAYIDENGDFILSEYRTVVQFYCTECGKTMKSKRWREEAYIDKYLESCIEQMKNRR